MFMWWADVSTLSSRNRQVSRACGYNRYENLKRELAARFDEVGLYADNKSAFVQAILEKACLWQETNFAAGN